jgi:hypothetical protein
MAAALREHPVARALFDPDRGRPEQTLIWRDKRTGVMRRARLDWLPDPGAGRLIIPDYKTCASAEPAALARAVAAYGYHQQDDWYRAGARALDLATRPPRSSSSARRRPRPTWSPSSSWTPRRAASAPPATAAPSRSTPSASAPAGGPATATTSPTSRCPSWAERTDTEEYL